MRRRTVPNTNKSEPIAALATQLDSAPPTVPTATPSAGTKRAKPARRIAIVNHKGGVGKTSTTVHLAGALHEMGHRVLLFDCDSQGDLSAVFLRDHDYLPYSIADIFAGRAIPTSELVRPTAYDNIFIVPADRRLNLVDKTHFENDPNVVCLADAVSEVQHDFDFILFDCPPRAHLSAFAALVAAGEVIVPCQPSQFSVRSMATLDDEIRIVQQSLNPHLAIRGYFLSMVASRSKTQETCRDMLVQALGEERVFKTSIPLLATLDTAINVRKPIVYHAKRSKAADIFRTFATELVAGVPYERNAVQAAA